MRRVIAFSGSRGWTDIPVIARVIEELDPTEIVVAVGDALGADAIIKDAAEARGFFVACVAVKPHWRRYGKSAGHKRNAAILTLGASELIAFWDWASPGTAGMIKMAQARGLPITIYNPDGRKGQL